jgi:hypothetical protein
MSGQRARFLASLSSSDGMERQIKYVRLSVSENGLRLRGTAMRLGGAFS